MSIFFYPSNFAFEVLKAPPDRWDSLHTVWWLQAQLVKGPQDETHTLFFLNYWSFFLGTSILSYFPEVKISVVFLVHSILLSVISDFFSEVKIFNSLLFLSLGLHKLIMKKKYIWCKWLFSWEQPSLLWSVWKQLHEKLFQMNGKQNNKWVK